MSKSPPLPSPPEVAAAGARAPSASDRRGLDAAAWATVEARGAGARDGASSTWAPAPVLRSALLLLSLSPAPAYFPALPPPPLPNTTSMRALIVVAVLGLAAWVSVTVRGRSCFNARARARAFARARPWGWPARPPPPPSRPSALPEGRGALAARGEGLIFG